MNIEWFDIRPFVLFLLVFFPLEHLFPIHDGKRLLRGGWLTDVLHFFISGIFIRAGLFALVWLSVQVGTLAVSPALRDWVQALPIWIQVIAATIIADLGFYLAHRLMHFVPWLWHFHAVHHSSEEMDWLAAYRVHPVDQVLVKGASYIPIFVLGFSTPAIAIAGFIYHWQALLIHSNVRVPLGPLKWLIASPEFHHWHHSNHPEAYDKNFAGQLPLWDWLFRTVHLPGKMPSLYGVNDPVPRNYPMQLAYPFVRIIKRLRSTPKRSLPADLAEGSNPGGPI